MKLMTILSVLALTASGGLACAAEATLDAQLSAFSAEWAHVNFEIHDPTARTAAAAQLVSEAQVIAGQYPGRAEPLVWEALASATEAGAKGGLGGLALAKSARQLLEKAERLNPQALGDGSVYTSLGSLYAQVPGFPIGFGDKSRARLYLQRALAVNPDGVDPNFFYGDFLMRQGDEAGAVKALEHALQAPARPGREVADRGRRSEAAALLEKLRKKSKA